MSAFFSVLAPSPQIRWVGEGSSGGLLRQISVCLFVFFFSKMKQSDKNVDSKGKNHDLGAVKTATWVAVHLGRRDPENLNSTQFHFRIR